ncbi:hypothetical protein [Chishuiella sp.]|uniref:hypothetical protein n=1 Tax=Chishuiella sp. TaxID=1969467 RepID=UPI0028AFC463|nr:hypothetical protein [Chishuiella sp.]
MYKLTKYTLFVTLFLTLLSLGIIITTIVPKVGSYSKSEMIETNQKFSKCGFIVSEFYQNNSTYKTGRYGIRKEILKEISLLNYPNFSGNINIRFIINCHNQIGNFRIKATNQSFDLVDLSNDLKKDIVHDVLKLKYWNNQPYFLSKDSYYQLNIKIRDGKVKDFF